MAVLSGLRPAAGPDAKAATGRIAAPVGMVIGVAGKFMALQRAGAPPAGPVFAQGAVAFAGFFLGRKKVTRTCWRWSTCAISGATPMWPVSNVR